MSQTTSQTSKIVVYHLADSRSQRIIWLLEELNLSYEAKRFEHIPPRLAPPIFKEVHPLGKSPVITDGDVTLAESGAIVEYIISKYGHGRLQPPETGFVDNLYYTYYPEGSLMPLLIWRFILTLMPDLSPFYVRPLARVICGAIVSNIIDPHIPTHITMVDKQLQKHPGGWIAGGDQPTSCDFMMMFPVEMMVYRLEDQATEAMRDYVRLIHERPAFKRALEKGGKYAFAAGF